MNHVPNRRATDFFNSLLGQAATDLLGGVVKLPGKTICLSFKPEIAQGLKDGTYTLMTNAKGEVFADAVKTSANGAVTVVGKGRLVQSGQAAQLAGGAFMLLSIAVSQKHLADIERSLGGIKKGIADLRDHMENKDRSEISGSIGYIQDILEHARSLKSPNLISSEKSHAIESIIKNSYGWLELVQSDLCSVNKSVNSIESKDTFGTLNTFKEIKEHITKALITISRYETYLKLAVAVKFASAYLDPMGLRFSVARDGTGDWLRMVDQLQASLDKKTKSLIGYSVSNSEELLGYRNSEVNSLIESMRFSAYEAVDKYHRAISGIDDQLKNLISDSGNIQLAVRYDSEGEIKEAAFITST